MDLRKCCFKQVNLLMRRDPFLQLLEKPEEWAFGESVDRSHPCDDAGAGPKGSRNRKQSLAQQLLDEYAKLKIYTDPSLVIVTSRPPHGHRRKTGWRRVVVQSLTRRPIRIRSLESVGYQYPRFNENWRASAVRSHGAFRPDNLRAIENRYRAVRQ